MAKHRRTPNAGPLPREGVRENMGTAYWSVEASGWPAVRPNLPSEMADLLAPPVVVGTAPVVPTSRLTPPPRAAVAGSDRPGGPPAGTAVTRAPGTPPDGHRSGCRSSPGAASVASPA